MKKYFSFKLTFIKILKILFGFFDFFILFFLNNRMHFIADYASNCSFLFSIRVFDCFYFFDTLFKKYSKLILGFRIKKILIHLLHLVVEHVCSLNFVTCQKIAASYFLTCFYFLRLFFKFALL